MVGFFGRDLVSGFKIIRLVRNLFLASPFFILRSYEKKTILVLKIIIEGYNVAIKQIEKSYI